MLSVIIFISLFSEIFSIVIEVFEWKKQAFMYLGLFHKEENCQVWF